MATKTSVVSSPSNHKTENGTSVRQKAIPIAGFSVVLAKPVKHELCIKFSVDGQDYPKLPYRHKNTVTEPHKWPLIPPLNVQEGSELIVRLRKRRRLCDLTLARIKVPFNDIRSFLDSTTPQDNHIEYEIHSNPKILLSLSAGHGTVQAGLNGAVQRSKELKSVLDHLGQAKGFMTSVLEVSTVLSGLHPIASAVMGCVNIVYEKLETEDQYDKAVLDLAESMARTIGYIEDVEQFARLAQLKTTIEEVYPLMEDTQNFILLMTSRSGMTNILKAHSIHEKIDDLNGRYAVFQQQFDRGVAVDTGAKTELLLKMGETGRDDALLKQLRPKGIKPSPPGAECMEGTRLTLLSDVDKWANDFTTSNVLWIRGFPGVGKSAVGSSIISRLRAQHRLGSYFVFDRSKVAVSTTNVLWRCVAYDLARQYPSARRCIVERLKDEEVEVNSSNIKTLFKSLIEAPLLESNDIPSGRLPVIVIDGLDECGGLKGRRSSDREALLETLQRWRRLSKKFKLILTSREEEDITKALGPFATPIDIPSGTSVNSQASDDIRAFLKLRFGKIVESYPDSLNSDWPGKTFINELADRAAGLFIWAKTVLEFINSGDPPTRLKKIMGHTLEMGNMAVLYTYILETSFTDPSPEALEAFNTLVGAMVLAERPLSRVDCLKLFDIPPTMLDFIRKGLRSVMDPGDTLHFTHLSFIDFLLSSDKCPAPFTIDLEKRRHDFVQACLRTMSANLCFNICDLETSTVRNADVPDIDTKIKNGIPTYLSYSCRFWADHLSNVPFDENLMVAVKQLVYDQLLYWLEVMSLLNELSEVAPIFTKVSKWSKAGNDESFQAFMNDALRFVAAFGYPIAQSAPHIYISALPFSPQQSELASRFLPRFSRTIQLITGKPVYWPFILFLSEEHNEAVNAVAFSPDQEYFVSGSSDKTICICDAETGNLISGPFAGHDSSVSSVAFSPDGQRVVSGSDDLTVRVWDAESGDELLCLPGHKGVVTCVLYFKDGRRIASGSNDTTIRLWDADSGVAVGEVFQGHERGITAIALSSDDRYIVSGSIDRTVRIWDVERGTCVYGPFGHENRVNAVVFSPDDHFIASGSEDESIYIWDVKTGDMVGDPLEGHTDAVTSVAYSPDGKYLMSGSHDETVKVWDPSTGEMLLELAGQTNGITSIAVTSDGKKLASGSRDETVGVWDLERREVTPASTVSDAHSDGVTCIAFSPCGGILASGSDDDTVRVWDAGTGKPLLEPIRGHSSWINAVAFSHDGKLLASGSDDQSICVWNVETGELAYKPLEGHRNSITCLAFLPVGRLVSGSYDETMRVWNVETAEVVFSPLTHHSSWVTSIAVSPDGKKAVSSSYDKTIKLWSTETGELIPMTFQGHTSAVNCVAFSSSGGLIASGSIDGTIHVWNAETGEHLAGPLQGHTQLIYSLAFSPDELFIFSGSGDRTIRVWDVGARCLVLGPWYGHADAVVGIALSRDGRKMASCSEDETIKVWDTSDLVKSSSLEHHLSERHHARGFTDNCSIQNGWVTDHDGELLFWLPPWNRGGLWWPRNTAVIADIATKLDLKRFEYGVSWKKCQDLQM